MSNGEEKSSGGIILWVIILVAGYFLFFKEEDTWMGFYYPNKNDLTRHTQSSELISIDDCRAWISSQVYIYNRSGAGYDYECGKNCSFNQDFGAYVCEETIR
jgi:hypothetical protein